MTIRANGCKSTGFVIEASEKIGGATMRLHVPDEVEMIRIAYFWNRLFICEKICNYLKQRIYALQLLRDHKLVNEATQLLRRIEACRLSSGTDLCDRVVAGADVIRAIAPSAKSAGQYHFYQHTVCGIVEFCREMAGGAVLQAIAEPEEVAV